MKFLLIASAGAVLAIAPAAAQAAPAAAGKPAATTQTRAEVQANAQRMFTRLDTNRDGFVTQAETDAVQTKRASKAPQRAQDPARTFARLDANKDGSVTRAEAEAGRNARLAAKGGQPSPAQAQGAAFSKLFARLDTNRDGTITKTELAASTRGTSVEKGSREAKPARILTLGDANKDGRLSLAEVQQLRLQRFDRTDLNRDGKVTPEERKQARQQMRAQRSSS